MWRHISMSTDTSWGLALNILVEERIQTETSFKNHSFETAATF